MQNCLRKIAPRRDAAGGHVVGTAGVFERRMPIVLRRDSRQYLRGRGGDVTAPSGRSDLILDNFQLLALRCKAQNR